MISQALRTGGRWVLDFVLPPRCAGCGIIVGELHSFCTECWTKIEFLGDGGCSACGLPLQATDSALCGACLAEPPTIARTRAAVAYDDLSRGVAIRLKYGRKVALARTMARYMAPLVEGRSEDCLLVPVPLHRSRLWWRGFNQAL
jgi:predicted amidophosphoribosyltransferase